MPVADLYLGAHLALQPGMEIQLSLCARSESRINSGSAPTVTRLLSRSMEIT